MLFISFDYMKFYLSRYVYGYVEQCSIEYLLKCNICLITQLVMYSPIDFSSSFSFFLHDWIV